MFVCVCVIDTVLYVCIGRMRLSGRGGGGFREVLRFPAYRRLVIPLKGVALVQTTAQKHTGEGRGGSCFIELVP